MTSSENASSIRDVEEEFETLSMQTASLLRAADELLLTAVQRLDNKIGAGFLSTMAVLDAATEKFKAAENAYWRDYLQAQSEIRSLKAELAAKAPAIVDRPSILT
ncbi:hypothetical protein G6L07_08030 [Agrobacterium rhizogenes]|nr:hypothetical protein [Rhizobium rhizogenes]